ncbi:MAG: hypothetical protein K2X93_00350 [Candidatus Obscuribacterales bacterium]|nr:hypothetical protein [Candidatus Obscuribacterales bacterium]
MHSYKHQKVILVTKHEKIRALRPLEICLDLRISSYGQFDTDQLGTFSGEVERQGTVRETVMRKVQAGMDETGIEFGIANEGSFGAHPEIPFLSADHEVIVFVDRKNDCVFFEEVVSTYTNYGHSVFSDFSELCSFAHLVGFPSHGLLMTPSSALYAFDRSSMLLSEGLTRGITDLRLLEDCFVRYSKLSPVQAVWVETDMRAHFNPSRMRNIRHAATKLARRLCTRCLKCKAPGFGFTDKEAGIPCANCKRPTLVIGWFIHACQMCGFRHKIRKYDEQYRADPQYCEVCNP